MNSPEIELKNIPISEINFGERGRHEYGNLEELVMSFKKEGIIQPLAVYRESSGSYRLLAGGRRFRAAEKAGISSIPVRIYSEQLSELEIRSIELAENIYRKDLTWAERVALDKQIYNLQVQIYGPKLSTSADATGVSRRDVASLLGRGAGTFVQDLAMADALEIFPELARYGTKDEARKVLQKIQIEIERDKIAKQLSEARALTPLDEQRKNLCDSFIVGDFFGCIESIPDESVDIVELDPPYGIGLDKLRKLDSLQKEQMQGYNEIPANEYPQFILNVLSECYRVMALDSWIVVWFGPDWFNTIHRIMQEVGFEVGIVPAFWCKVDEVGGMPGQTMQPDKYLANSVEMFFYGRKSSARIVKQGRSNAFIYRAIHPTKKVHQTERPIEMIQEILSTFSENGSSLLVPFLGSGNTLLSGSNLGMQGVGFELTKEYKDAFIMKAHSSEPGRYTSYV